MTNLSTVVRIKVDAWAEATDANNYDCIVATCGYESRASFFTRRYVGSGTRVIAYAYPHHKTLSYADNFTYFTRIGEVFEEPESRIGHHLAMELAKLYTQVSLKRREHRAVRVALDISSMDRFRLSQLLRAISGLQNGLFEFDLVYSPAEFNPSLTGSEGRIVVNRPLPTFGGWGRSPSVPLACVMGLGFEGELALAALETIEPGRTLLFRPRGIDPRYDERVIAANKYVLRDGNESSFEYDLTRPFELFQRVESLTSMLLESNRVVLVPMGPKLFALAALLTALAHPDAVSVWRVSADFDRSPEDRVAVGDVLGLRLTVDS